MTVETKNPNIYSFEADARKTLELVINSIYKNNEVFLRELVSNASDACDKLRLLSLTNQDLIDHEHRFEITISSVKDKNIIKIKDTGIGMNEEDLKSNLGTIARSGTSKFIDMMKKQEQKNDLSTLIGKFGVGFYSIFMVAKKATVITKKAGEETAYKWLSDGMGTFEIIALNKEESKNIKGTEIELELKEEHTDFLDKFKIRNIVESYSEYTNFPIKFISEENGEVEILNSSNAIWLKNKKDVSDEEHQKFFNSVAHVGGAPWLVIHNRNEGGAIDFINLLYIPSIKPFDLFHPDRKCSVKLYVNRVFITEDAVELVPKNFRFVRGIVDCSDIPLNVSRETLQNDRNVLSIKKAITKKIINELAKKMKDDRQDYEKSFWINFGSVLKEGLCDHLTINDSEKFLSICLFYSLKHKKMITLDEYITDMLDTQNTIYYLSANNIEQAAVSPQTEGFLSRNMDVIVLTDPVDDFWTNIINNYKNIAIKSITRSNIDLQKNDKKNEDCDEKDDNVDNSEITQLIDYMKSILKDDVKDVIISKKLTTSPICLSVQEGAMDIRMERFMIEQKQLHSKTKKTLEINPDHPLIKNLIKMEHNSKLNSIIKMLFCQSCIVEGEEISSPSEFANDLTSLLLDTINIKV
ncbi:molecular chaperone HtpG [Anaplasmataceae bacterium AB001_6]|nr:molecular chaperone HtpG [Anaplasmataceae bacterium AB001_6]